DLAGRSRSTFSSDCLSSLPRRGCGILVARSGEQPAAGAMGFHALPRNWAPAALRFVLFTRREEEQRYGLQFLGRAQLDLFALTRAGPRHFGGLRASQ